MSSGGGSTKSTNVTQNYSPEEAKRRAQVMDEAQAIYQLTRGRYQDYPGAAPVAFDPATVQAQQQMLAASTLADIGAMQGAQALQYGLTDAMDVENNPYFQSALNATMRPLQTQLTQGLQQVGSAAQQAGAYGGGRHGVAEALAFDKSAMAMSDAAARMGSEAYAQGQDTFGRTLALLPQTVQAYGTGAQYSSAVGAQRENLAQALEQYEADQRQWQMNAPWVPLENYANIVYGGGGSQSTSTNTYNQPRNQLMGVAGGAMMGASVGGPWGALIGGVLGAFL